VDRHEVSYQKKLAQIRADLESGAIDKLTLQIGRERFKLRDSRTRRAQKELVKSGLLVESGRTFCAAA